ncbi:MAG: citramalate synthase [Gemmataceae bacterium]|nr:citramalate synthase [Gemmataceae bacterium]MCI0740879.1 citramalate synthase [Gemmataceae bacterium]
MTRIQIYDTTLRDGSQGEGVNFSLQDKLLVTRRLDDLGVDYIEGGYPLSNPKDFEYFQEVRKLPLKHAKVCAFGMTRRKNCKPEDDTCLKALLDSQAPVVTIVGKTWDFQVREVIGATLEENLRMIADSVAYCKANGREVIYDAEHFFDGFKHNTEYALQTLKVARDAGASVMILCDTNGGTLPEEIAERTGKVVQAFAGTAVGIHCHNDCDVAVANSLAAVTQGATQVQGTINGIGERCGNVDLVSVIANLALKRGYEVLRPGSLLHLTEVSRYVYEIANMNFRSNQPFVGTSAFAHKGGMHAHAVAKSTATYEHIDPGSVGNERRILISELSGQSSIVAKTTKYDIQNDKVMMAKIMNLVQDLENEGYEFEAAEASFDLLVRKALGTYKPKFERLAYRVNVETGGAGQTITEATVKIRIGEQSQHTVSEGDGPVNALDGALRKALQHSYPGLAQMQLVDYKVRVVNSKAGTAARVRVVIESRDHADVWGTVGVSENIIEASWLALVDSFEYKLFKDEEDTNL